MSRRESSLYNAVHDDAEFDDEDDYADVEMCMCCTMDTGLKIAAIIPAIFFSMYVVSALTFMHLDNLMGLFIGNLFIREPTARISTEFSMTVAGCLAAFSFNSVMRKRFLSFWMIMLLVGSVVYIADGFARARNANAYDLMVLGEGALEDAHEEADSEFKEQQKAQREQYEKEFRAVHPGNPTQDELEEYDLSQADWEKIQGFQARVPKPTAKEYADAQMTIQSNSEYFYSNLGKAADFLSNTKTGHFLTAVAHDIAHKGLKVIEMLIQQRIVHIPTQIIFKLVVYEHFTAYLFGIFPAIIHLVTLAFVVQYSERVCGLSLRVKRNAF